MVSLYSATPLGNAYYRICDYVMRNMFTHKTVSGEDRNKFADKFVFVGKTRINLLIWQADNINYADFLFFLGGYIF